MEPRSSKMTGWAGAALLVLSLALLQACGGKSPVQRLVDQPSRLRVEILASADANRGPGGKPLPVVVRVYELRGQGAFTTADFFSLYDRETEVLGQDLIARDEVTLAPGQFLPLERPLEPDAAYLGVLAAFRDLDHSHWREPLRLKPGTDNDILVEVGAKAVSVRHR